MIWPLLEVQSVSLHDGKICGTIEAQYSLGHLLIILHNFTNEEDLHLCMSDERI